MAKGGLMYLRDGRVMICKNETVPVIYLFYHCVLHVIEIRSFNLITICKIKCFTKSPSEKELLLLEMMCLKITGKNCSFGYA